MYQKAGSTSTLIKYDSKGNVEDLEPVNEVVKLQKRHFKKGSFYMQTMEFDKLILDKQYNSTTIKVLLVLKSRIDYNNRIKGFKQVELAERIGSSQANVSRALKLLLKDNIIYLDGIDYYFNDSYIKYAGDGEIEKKTNKN